MASLYFWGALQKYILLPFLSCETAKIFGVGGGDSPSHAPLKFRPCVHDLDFQIDEDEEYVNVIQRFSHQAYTFEQ